MMTFLASTLGAATVGFYVYMGVMAGWGASKSGDSMFKAAVKGATWPVSMWNVMHNMYKAEPDA